MKCCSLGLYMTPIYKNTYFQLKVYFNDNKLEKSFFCLPLSWLAPAIPQTLDSAQEKFNPWQPPWPCIALFVGCCGGHNQKNSSFVKETNCRGSLCANTLLPNTFFPVYVTPPEKFWNISLAKEKCQVLLPVASNLGHIKGCITLPTCSAYSRWERIVSAVWCIFCFLNTFLLCQ